MKFVYLINILFCGYTLGTHENYLSTQRSASHDPVRSHNTNFRRSTSHDPFSSKDLVIGGRSPVHEPDKSQASDVKPRTPLSHSSAQPFSSEGRDDSVSSSGGYCASGIGFSMPLRQSTQEVSERSERSESDGELSVAAFEKTKPKAVEIGVNTDPEPAVEPTPERRGWFRCFARQ